MKNYFEIFLNSEFTSGFFLFAIFLKNIFKKIKIIFESYPQFFEKSIAVKVYARDNCCTCGDNALITLSGRSSQKIIKIEIQYTFMAKKKKAAKKSSKKKAAKKKRI